VLAIQPKRTESSLVSFLGEEEIEALIAAPDRSSWTGRRDHAMLMLAAQTGLRASELTRLRCADLQLGGGPHVSCVGKGRKQRITPLTTHTVAVLVVWLDEHGRKAEGPLFPTRTGGQLSRDALERRIAKHAAAAAGRCPALPGAARRCPALPGKKVTAHVLRHSAAMRLLQAGADTSVIALWLGHEHIETTQVYLHADLQIKERALARTRPPEADPGRYRPPNALLAFLETL